MVKVGGGRGNGVREKPVLIGEKKLFATESIRGKLVARIHNSNSVSLKSKCQIIRQMDNS